MDRRCEFWLQFENGVKMFAEMIDPVALNTDLIPPNENLPQSRNEANRVKINPDEQSRNLNAEVDRSN